MEGWHKNIVNVRIFRWYQEDKNKYEYGKKFIHTFTILRTCRWKVVQDEQVGIHWGFYTTLWVYDYHMIEINIIFYFLKLVI